MFAGLLLFLRKLSIFAQEFTLDGTVLCFEYLYILIGVYPHAILGYLWDALRAYVWELYERIVFTFFKTRAPRYKSGTTNQFYSQRMYAAIVDCFNRPIASAPSTWIDAVDRKWVGKRAYEVHVENTNTNTRCLNVGSYNYLGFGGFDKNITPEITSCVEKDGITQGITPCELGIPIEQVKLERTIADFLGKPDCAVIPMGYGTNAFIISMFVKEGDLVISDKLNHASIAIGVRLSGAKCSVFRHNNMHDLELKIQEGIKQGFKKILIIVEGMYSMEGETCPLPEIVELKERYNVYLYIDEAHSIGALGKTGHGVCEYYNIPTSKVDVLMGTLTKSFGSIGGYICSTTEVISKIRRCSSVYRFGRTIPSACALQARKVFEALQKPEYCDRPEQLRQNAIKFRKALVDMGCWILGNDDSPVIPLLLHHPQKISSFTRLLRDRRVATVCVGYPATPLLKARARFCLSAGHTEEDLQFALRNIEEVVKLCGVDYFNHIPRPPPREAPTISHEPVDEILELRQTPPPLVEADNDALDYQIPIFDEKLIQLSGYDFGGIANDTRIINKAVDTINFYGVGSCGPRGFYGTIKPHLELEKRLEELTQMEKAVIYSYELPAVMGLIPTYNPQIVVCDEQARFGIQKGIYLSRAKCYYYRHNDMRSLENVLASIAADPELGNKKYTRKFIITEGVFENTGKIAHLPIICHLKRKYGYYLILDESISFGSLGKTGKGLQEFWSMGEQKERQNNKRMISNEEDLKMYPFDFHKDVDLMVGSLEKSLCSLGGFCCGSKDFVELQVLFASSYCFSASSPPYTCAAAQTALDLLNNTKRYVKLSNLINNALCIVTKENGKMDYAELFEVSSEHCSPLIHLSIPKHQRISDEQDTRLLEYIAKQVRQTGYNIAVHPRENGTPSLRLTVSNALSRDQFAKGIKEVFRAKQELDSQCCFVDQQYCNK